MDPQSNQHQLVDTSSASLVSAVAKTQSLRCVSSSNHKRFAGLRFEFCFSCTLKTEQRYLVVRRLHCLHYCRSSPRAISTGQLHTLLHFHLRPIYQVVFLGPYSIKDERSNLRGCFTLRCLQRLSRPYIATQLCPWQDNWCTRGMSIPVLSY